jgi:hypothetical protein
LTAYLHIARAQGHRFPGRPWILPVHRDAVFRVHPWIFCVHGDAVFGASRDIELVQYRLLLVSSFDIVLSPGLLLFCASVDIVRAKGRRFWVRPWILRVHRDAVFGCFGILRVYKGAVIG